MFPKILAGWPTGGKVAKRLLRESGGLLQPQIGKNRSVTEFIRADSRTENSSQEFREQTSG
jgi:hypothetical protein